MRGKFITLEGLDGAGKSTHLPWLANLLESRGIRVRTTREPGGTPVGERVRELLLLGSEALHPETEALLMFAARREHLDKVILPALDGGEWVVCDRFTDATYAYQGGGSGVARDKLAELERWVHPGLEPDVTFYFDVSPETAKARASNAREPDRFEKERASFHERVREAYLRRATGQPRRIHVIDASAGLGEVQEELRRIVSRLGQEV